jgi:hypothetical protein
MINIRNSSSARRALNTLLRQTGHATPVAVLVSQDFASVSGLDEVAFLPGTTHTAVDVTFEWEASAFDDAPSVIIVWDPNFQYQYVTSGATVAFSSISAEVSFEGTYVQVFAITLPPQQNACWSIIADQASLRIAVPNTGSVVLSLSFYHPATVGSITGQSVDVSGLSARIFATT